MPDHQRAGCRSRGFLIPLGIVCLLLAAFVGRELYLALTATPGSAVDYHALAEELVASYQPAGDENGWDLLVEAVRLKQDAAAQTGHGDLLDEGYTYIRSPSDYTFGDDEPTAEDLRAAGIEGLDALREAGVWDLLDQLARSPRVIRPLPGQERLFFELMPELGQSRSLARALAARMKLSHDADDGADDAAAYAQGCGIARTFMHQYTLLDQLVGIAIFAVIDRELRHELAERPLDEQSLLTIADALDRLAFTPPQLPFEGERLILLDIIQRMHTDNGHGSGRRILSQEWGPQGFTGNAPAGRSRLSNLASIAYPSKRQTTQQADRFYTAAIEAAQTPRRQRDAIQFDPDAWVDQLHKQQFVLRMLVPALWKGMESRDLFDAMRAGSRTMVAIELHNARHGAYPDALDDLVPEFLPMLPADPFAPDRGFIYRRIDPATDPHNRPYLLYSVGHDGNNDGGQVIGDEPHRALTSGHPGTDYVFNLPRPLPHDDDN